MLDKIQTNVAKYLFLTFQNLVEKYEQIFQICIIKCSH